MERLTFKQESRVKEHLEHLVAQMLERGVSYELVVLAFKRHFAKLTLERTGGNLSMAARALGVHRNTLARKIEEWGLGSSLKQGSKLVTLKHSHEGH
jgi:Fis family transcriptional regulator, factor for inversion stimulation protein